MLRNIIPDYCSLPDLPRCSLWLSLCPCGGDNFAIPLAGIKLPTAVRRGREFHLSFHTNLPVLTTVSSQQKRLRAYGQAGTWALSKWKLTQPKPRQMHKDSTQRTGIPSRERQSSLSAAALTYAKQKRWQLQTDLPHHRLSPNIPQINFSAQVFPLPVLVY